MQPPLIYLTHISVTHCSHSDASAPFLMLPYHPQDIPSLASACESFSSQSSSVLDQYSQNKQLAASQSALLEVLEVMPDDPCLTMPPLCHWMSLLCTHWSLNFPICCPSPSSLPSLSPFLSRSPS